jgi:DNA-binding CsgD family transcriptional regulator
MSKSAGRYAATIELDSAPPSTCWSPRSSGERRIACVNPCGSRTSATWPAGTPATVFRLHRQSEDSTGTASAGGNATLRLCTGHAHHTPSALIFSMTLARGSPGSRLLGRDRECASVRQPLVEARARRSGVLVLRGEAGSGKTALLRYARDQAVDFRVARVAGVQSEMELPYAGLHQLCAPLLDRLERLPPPQRNALEVTFGLREEAAPDRFLTGLAVLSLLADAAEEQNLLCLVDDAQWLDRASLDVLSFAARRLSAEPIAVVLAIRDGLDSDQYLTDLPTLTVSPLGEKDARRVLLSRVQGRLDEQVQQRIVAEARGNPLALVELPRALTPAELAGGFAVPDARPALLTLERSFLRRLHSLPADSQLLVLAAAAEPVGDSEVLLRAAQALGVAADALEPAQAEGLLEVGARVRFRHPLVRSAVYQAASVQDRRAVHRALASATRPESDPDRRAWHRAHAADGPDEEVATELERSSSRAMARGGVAAAAAFLEQAATLSADPLRRRRRALDAAELKLQAGAFDAAAALLAIGAVGPADERLAARSQLVRGHLAFATNRGSEAPGLLVEAARGFEGLDDGAARDAYLEALLAGLFAGRLATGTAAVDVARAAGQLARPSAPGPADLLLEGMTRLFTEGHAAAGPVLRQAVEAVRQPGISVAEQLHWLPLTCTASVELWDDESWYQDTARYVNVVRDSGALTELPFALNHRSVALAFAGELTAASELLDEAKAVAVATDNTSALAPYAEMTLAAWQGREEQTLALAATCILDVTERGEGNGLTVAHWTLALLHNGLGRYQDALAAAEVSCAFPTELGSSYWGVIELVEAAVRTGAVQKARVALGSLSAATRSVRSEWALGVEARSRALVTDSEDAYLEAIGRLERTRVHTELARAHLVYGEWLRRQQRRTQAREQLRVAADLTSAMGLEAFNDRAVRELRATGEKVLKRRFDPPRELTPQESQVARYARDGLSNPEIGVRLFLSARTIEWHLGKVFAKLGIASRSELPQALGVGAPVAPARQRTGVLPGTSDRGPRDR